MTPVPEWFTVFDAVLCGLAGFCFGFVAGHMLGKFTYK